MPPEFPDLSEIELALLESDLNKLGTPPDNIFRRMLAEIRRRRRNARPRKKR